VGRRTISDYPRQPTRPRRRRAPTVRPRRVRHAHKRFLPHEVASVQQAACIALEPAFVRSDTDTAAGWVLRCGFDLAQLWRCGELWAVTQVLRGKRGLVLQIVGMAGAYDPALVDAIESWARRVGCVRLLFTGRRGWLRRVPGYRMTTVTAIKEL
jgi:hypothetical protein